MLHLKTASLKASCQWAGWRWLCDRVAQTLSVSVQLMRLSSAFSCGVYGIADQYRIPL